MTPEFFEASIRLAVVAIAFSVAFFIVLGAISILWSTIQTWKYWNAPADDDPREPAT